VGYFSLVTTAEDARAYKPSERIFIRALDSLGLTAAEVLHVGMCPWADVGGAKPLGFRVAWINRDKSDLGRWAPWPDFEFNGLDGLLQVLSIR
jgi:2-haloacid dehalogenase